MLRYTLASAQQLILHQTNTICYYTGKAIPPDTANGGTDEHAQIGEPHFGLMADHLGTVGAFVDIAELLLYQRTGIVTVAVTATIAWQILTPHDLWFMSASLIALVSDTVVCRKHGEHRRGSEP